MSARGGGRGGYTDRGRGAAGGRGGGQQHVDPRAEAPAAAGRGRGGYTDRGRGGGGRGGGSAEPPPKLRIETADAATLPSMSVDAVQPHLFGGIRSQAEKSTRPSKEEIEQRKQQRERDAKDVNDALRGVRMMAPDNSVERSQKIPTNYFPVQCSLKTSFMVYDVVLEPEVVNPRQRREIVRELVESHAKTLKVPGGIYRNKILYAPRSLHPPNKKEVSITHTANPSRRGWRAKGFTVKLTHTRDIAPTREGLSTEYYNVITSILAEALEEAQLIKLGEAYYDINTVSTASGSPLTLSEDKYGSLQLMKGFQFALHPTKKGLMLNVDMTFRTTRACTVLDHIKKIISLEKNPKDAQKVIAEELEGCIAVTTYQHERRRAAFKISQVLFDKSPAAPMSGATPAKSFKQYMQEMHNITLADDKQPLLRHISKREVDKDGKPKELFYIPELSRLVGQSTRMRANAALQQELKKHCLVDSNTRFNAIFEFVSQFVQHKAVKPFLEQWGVTIVPKMVAASARVLPTVSLQIEGDKPLNQQEARRSWLIKKGLRPSVLPAPPSMWTYVYPGFVRDQAKAFLEVLMVETINGCGGKWPNPEELEYQTSPNPANNLRTLKERVLPEIDEQSKFVLFVLPDDNEDFYVEVKRNILQEWKIPSQCVLRKNVANERNHLNVASRVGGQMLVKAGGALWHAAPTQRGGLIDPPDCIVCGIDYAKSTKGEVVALVGVGAPKYEHIGTFSSTASRGAVSKLLEQLVRAYVQQYKKPPKNIIFFRSGMHEGDVANIVESELKGIADALGKQKINFCFVASLKRCHARFHDPPSGCVVDTDITGAYGFSFLMVPQTVNIGTATAMKFSVLANTISELNTAAVLEALTFKLCHMFYGWWSTTREPAPVMYATRHADLASKVDLRKPLGGGAKGFQAF